MNKHDKTPARPPLETLACITEGCELRGQPGQGNLTVRKVYGKDQIRYLRCRACGAEFSERKKTALWNTKVAEQQAVAVAEHLAEGCSLKGTARLVRVDASTVRRLNRRVGEHGKAFHDERVQAVEVETLQADERHGYARDKGQALWEAEIIDPLSKFVLSHVQGRRDERLTRCLLEDGASRLKDRHSIALMSDGDASYATLFPEVFGQPYRPARRGARGRLPGLRYRIPRRLAHVQVIKHRVGTRLEEVEIGYTHGSQKRVLQTLAALGHHRPNTSIIERRNATARRMSAHQVRKSLAFSRRPETKTALGWWGVTVYNWCRSHRSLRQPLAEPQGKKSSSSERLPWLWAWPTTFSPSVRFS
jgi:IS1 family transposase/transposase-like protein